jgi:5'-deoxynucleotidase YfbR-like HD superfamily hydrolase
MLRTTELMRASHVNRWQIVLTNRPQSLAEHSFNVAMLAQSIAFNCEVDFSTDQLYELMNWALLHDIIEIRTGDLATPFKTKLRQFGG